MTDLEFRHRGIKLSFIPLWSSGKFFIAVVCSLSEEQWHQARRRGDAVSGNNKRYNSSGIPATVHIS
jgi:hypothetical protein